MANYSSAKRTSRDRVFICFVLGAGATAAAIVTASALAPHPPVAPCGPGVPHDLIAQSGQGLPSFPEIVDAIGGSGRLDPRRKALMSIGRPLASWRVSRLVEIIAAFKARELAERDRGRQMDGLYLDLNARIVRSRSSSPDLPSWTIGTDL